MGLIEPLIIALIHFVAVGLDIVGFFLIVRLIVIVRPANRFGSLDRIGRSLVDGLIGVMTRGPSHVKDHHPVRDAGAVSLWLAAIGLCRLLVVALSGRGAV